MTNTPQDPMYYPSQMFLFRDSFRTRAEYLAAYQDCCKHYGFKARVNGGWKFFEFYTDFLTWKAQK